MMHQTVFDTSEIFRRCGVEQVVICPGSRNAPLTISFVRNPGIIKHSVVDERSAGFIAMGIAQRTNKPVVVCCTSGSAILNLAPACAEAFYQEVPVIFISADRPPEWTDQGDGQTIRQPNILEPHVKKSFQLPVDVNHSDAQWEYRRKLCESVGVAATGIQGPVHINIPFREPFYPSASQELEFSKDLTTSLVLEGHQVLPDPTISPLRKDWQKFKRKVFVLGQGTPPSEELQLLRELSERQKIPIIADVISNASGLSDFITQQDLFLGNTRTIKELQPDLVVTFGKTLISKNLKIALRSDIEHWHVGLNRATDTFQSLHKTFVCDPRSFLESILDLEAQDPSYLEKWHLAEEESLTIVNQALNDSPYCEFKVFRDLMNEIPDNSHVHLANSMIVRYANFFTPKNKSITFHGNRGTSGIDGATSTAVGFTADDVQNILITGDLSALYDRNAFLNDLKLSGFKVIVSNNNGGGIFDLIPGPKVLPEVERHQYFETRHAMEFQRFAQEIDFKYYVLAGDEEVDQTLRSFFEDTSNALLEIKTETEINGKIFGELKALLKQKSPFGDS